MVFKLVVAALYGEPFATAVGKTEVSIGAWIVLGLFARSMRMGMPLKDLEGYCIDMQ